MSKIFPDITKHRRELVKVIEDGSAKTFVYKDLDEKSTKESFWSRLFNKNSETSQKAVDA